MSLRPKECSSRVKARLSVFRGLSRDYYLKVRTTTSTNNNDCNSSSSNINFNNENYNHTSRTNNVQGKR